MTAPKLVAKVLSASMPQEIVMGATKGARTFLEAQREAGLTICGSVITVDHWIAQQRCAAGEAKAN